MRRILFLVPFLVLLLLPGAGSCEPSSAGTATTYTITAAQLNRLETNLTQLKQDNAKLKTLYEQSQRDLTSAREQSATLQKQVASLQSQLTTLREQATKADSSLTTAGSELQNAKTLYEKSEREHIRTEKRLRAQRNAWELVAGGLLLYLAF